MLDLILLAYLVLIAVGAFVSRKDDVDYLSPKVTTSVRGIAAIGIIMHHMAERTLGGTIFPFLVIAGYLLVTTFFFLSGYGLLVQYEKRKDYLDGFLVKRFLYLVLVYLLDIAVYTIYDFAMGKPHTVGEILKSIFTSGIASNSWYMIVLILFYLAFYFIFKFMPKLGTGKKIAAVFVFQLAFAGVCILFSRPSMWYVSNLGFSLGMLWAYKKEYIDKLLREKYILMLAAVVLSFAVFYVIPPALEHFFGETVWTNCIRTACRLVSSPLSAALVAVLLFKFKPILPIWNFLGNISLEIYLIHGMVYRFLRSSAVYIESECLWVILTIVIAVLLAIPANRLNQVISKKLRGTKKEVRS